MSHVRYFLTGQWKPFLSNQLQTLILFVTRETSINHRHKNVHLSSFNKKTRFNIFSTFFVYEKTLANNASYNYRVGQRSKPAYSCNNFAWCQPTFKFFCTYALCRKLASGRYHVQVFSPANTIWSGLSKCHSSNLHMFHCGWDHRITQQNDTQDFANVKLAKMRSFCKLDMYCNKYECTIDQELAGAAE